jgi:DNA polymerase-3 subunit delta'
VLSPYEARRRVFVLRRIDMATLEAANSLLKTLEEPPRHVVLILTAVHVEQLPETIVSRCQRLDLRPAAFHVVEEALQERGVSASQSLLLARLSGGRLGWALSAAGDEAVLRRRQQDLDQLIELLSQGRVARFDFAWKTSRDLDASRELVELWTSWWRDLLLLLGQGDDHLVNIDRSDELKRMAGQMTVPEAQAVLRALQEAAAQLDARVNARLALEGLLLRFPYWQPAAAGRLPEVAN